MSYCPECGIDDSSINFYELEEGIYYKCENCGAVYQLINASSEIVEEIIFIQGREDGPEDE